MRRILALLVCLCLVACQGERDELRIGSGRWLGYAPLYLADELERLEPKGIRLVEYPNTTGVLRGFRNGLLDAAMLTLDETLALQASGHDLEILLVTNLSAGADALYALPPIRNLTDLRHQRIGVENTALGAFFMSRILDEAGLAEDDVTLVSLPVHEHVAAMRAHRIDAVVSFASSGPALTELGARRIFDSRALPGEIIDVLVVDRRRVGLEQRHQLRQLWYTHLSDWQENRASADAHLQSRLGLSTEMLHVMREGLVMGDRQVNQQLRESGQLQHSIDRIARYMHERHLLDKPTHPDKLLTRCREYQC